MFAMENWLDIQDKKIKHWFQIRIYREWYTQGRYGFCLLTQVVVVEELKSMIGKDETILYEAKPDKMTDSGRMHRFEYAVEHMQLYEKI